MSLLSKLFEDGRPLKKESEQEPIFGYNEVQRPAPISETERNKILKELESRGLQFETRNLSIPSVKEIHDNFFTDSERMLADANVLEVIKIQDQKFEEKAKKMSSLGFTGHPDVIRYNELIQNREKAIRNNEHKKLVIECIQYFQQKYPGFKYISMEGVNRICHKYSLAYGPVNKYIGEIPNRNLEFMVNFKCDDSDKARIKKGQWDSLIYEESEEYSKTLASWVICAPANEFDLRNHEIVKGQVRPKIYPKDPVVIQPVRYEYNKNGWKMYMIGGLIVTAWGPEASDYSVANEKMN